jgi:hypothetical protein
VLENSALWVKVGLKFANESVEPIIEFPNVFVGSFANFEVLRIKGCHTFFFTPSLHESPFQIFRGFEASIWEFINPGSGTPGERVQEKSHKRVKVFFF